MSECLEIRKEFSKEELTQYQIDLMTSVRERCTEMLYFIEDKLGDTRYNNICITKLEEFCMFANKGIAKCCKSQHLCKPGSDNQ